MSGKLRRALLRLALLISSLLLVTLIACRAEGPENGQTPAPTIKSPSLVPQEVPITTLLRNPASFGGQTIWVTGQYRSLPLQVCGDTTHRSPATWTLVFGDVETFVAGFDEALRPLAASGLSLTIEGRWQRWEGPVGCGRRAPVQEIWYLEAARIVSPNPLVRSDSDDGGIVLVPSPTPEGETPEEPPPIATSEGEGPGTGPGTEPGTEPEEEATPTPTPSPTFQSIPVPPPGATNTATPRPSATPETTGGDETSTPTPTPSVTPTMDGTAGTGTPTTTPSVTTSGSTPGATATPADQGVIAFDSIEKSILTANSPHSWRFMPGAGEPIIITAGSALALNINIDLVAPDGTVVAKANLAAAGKPETITYTTPNPAGEYKIIISGENGTSGAYILMAFDSGSEPVVVMRDTISYGSGGSGNIPAGIDHFWNFEGQAGDVITIEVSPAGSSGDLVLYLVDPDGSDDFDLIDETGPGESESLVSYTLPETGFYSIGIGEFSFGLVDYTMTLTQ